MRVPCLVAILILAASSAVWAQVVDTQTVVVAGPVPTERPVTKLDDLNRLFVSGEDVKARQLARGIVDAARTTTSHEAFNYDKHHLAIVWAAVDVSGKTVLRRLMLKGSTDRPYALDLPGIGVRSSDPQLYELFLSIDRRATLVTVYRSTPEENPLLAQIPALAEKIIGPLIGLVAGVAGEPEERRLLAEEGRKEGEAPPQVYVTASAVKLPFRRATVQAKSTAHLPMIVERFKEAAASLASALRFTDVALSEPARRYAALLATAAASAADACATGRLAARACLEAFDTAFGAEYRRCEQTCGPDGTRPGDTDLNVIRTVDAKFRELVANGPERVEADVSFRNRPLTYFSFGAGTGVVLDPKMRKVRAKLEGDQVVADPLGRELTMILMNWSPTGYDADTISPTWSERLRFFWSAILTPDFGVGFGGSFLLVRGLALNGGVGWLFTRAVSNEDLVGKPPANRGDPFELGGARVWVVGATFNLK